MIMTTEVTKGTMPKTLFVNSYGPTATKIYSAGREMKRRLNLFLKIILKELFQ